MTAQTRRMFFGLLLTIAGGVWVFVTAFSASQGYLSSLIPLAVGIAVLAVGVYLLGRFVVIHTRK